MSRRSRALIYGTAAVALAGAVVALRTTRPGPEPPPESGPPPDGARPPEPDPPAPQPPPARLPGGRQREPYRHTLPLPGTPGDTVVSDIDANRAERRDAAGKVVWSTPLHGYLGLVRPPHLLADADRVYVTHADGVTALDARTGKESWHAAGPADRMLLSGDLLLAAQCGSGESITRSGRWVTARAAATGAEVFRVALPASFDPLPIREEAGLFLVQDHDAPGGAGLALLIDRGGRVRHRFDREVVAVRPAGAGLLVLTGRDVVRLSAAGEAEWSAPFGEYEWLAGGGLVPLPGGDVAAFVYGQISDSGVRVVRLDPAGGAKRWEAFCGSLGATHSGYNHEASLVAAGDRLTVTSRGSYGTFVEVLDAATGRQVSRKAPKE